MSDDRIQRPPLDRTRPDRSAGGYQPGPDAYTATINRFRNVVQDWSATAARTASAMNTPPGWPPASGPQAWPPGGGAQGMWGNPPAAPNYSGIMSAQDEVAKAGMQLLVAWTRLMAAYSQPMMGQPQPPAGPQTPFGFPGFNASTSTAPGFHGSAPDTATPPGPPPPPPQAAAPPAPPTTPRMATGTAPVACEVITGEPVKVLVQARIQQDSIAANLEAPTIDANENIGLEFRQLIGDNNAAILVRAHIHSGIAEGEYQSPVVLADTHTEVGTVRLSIKKS